MRHALQLGIIFLLIAVLVRVLNNAAEQHVAGRIGAADGVSIVVSVHGPLMPVTRLPGGAELLEDAILIDEQICKLTERPRGMRVAVIEPGLQFDSFANYDLARSVDDREDFLDVCAARPAGTVLVLAGRGSLAPEGDDRLGAEVARELAALGSAVGPIERAASSWALITIRQSDRWIPLAEAWSETSGVVLAFTVAPDPAFYTDHRAEVVQYDLPFWAEVALDGEVSGADVTTRLSRVRFGQVGARARPSILALTTEDRDGRLVGSARWDGVVLPEGAYFKTYFGLRTGFEHLSQGVRFALLVDGEVIRDATVRPGDSGEPRWHAWGVELDAFAGRPVSLELLTESVDDDVVDHALWGAPQLLFGASAAEARATQN